MHYQELVKDVNFLSKVNMLFTKTENLELSSKAIETLKDTYSVGVSKLISALLLERTFLLGLVKSFVSPHVPTLQELIRGPNYKPI